MTAEKELVRKLRDALLFDANHLVATGFSESGHEVRKHRALIAEAEAYLASVQGWEPVAWRWRYAIYPQTDAFWTYVTSDPGPTNRLKTVEPLYTHPAPQESGGWVRDLSNLAKAVEFLDLCRKDDEACATGAYRDGLQWLEEAARELVASPPTDKD